MLEKEKAKKIIEADIKYSDVLLPYLTGQDINESPNLEASRFAIFFHNYPLNPSYENASKGFVGPPFAEDYPLCISIVKEFVKPEREQNSEKSRREKWWLYGRNRPELSEAIIGKNQVIAIARVSKTVAFELINKNQVFADALVIISDDRFSIFCILQSTIHVNWAWKYCTTLKTDLNYTATETFETFPFPINLSTIQEQQLENTGYSYNQYRRQFIQGVQLGLTKTYNLFHDSGLSFEESINVDPSQLSSKEISKVFGRGGVMLKSHLDICPESTYSLKDALLGIQKLRKLHIGLDLAVLEAYGWSDIQLRHDFYEVDYLPENDRIRFTIHPDARREVLKRLLELNHKIYAEEVAQGLHDKKKTKTIKTDSDGEQQINNLGEQGKLFEDGGKQGKLF